MSDYLCQFEKIYIDVYYPSDKKNVNKIRGNFKEPGKLRFAAMGLGWKGSKEVYTAAKESFKRLTWYRACRNYELCISLKDQTIIRLQGFLKDDLEKLKTAAQKVYKCNIEIKEFSVKGWNWGRAEFDGSDLIFGVNDKPTFELPLSKVANTNLVAKNEVSLEFLQPEDPLVKKAPESKKFASDELVEMRFYIPNSSAVNKEDNKAEGDDQEVQSAAAEFYETIKDRADLQVSGEAICLFSETLFITPRGRYDVDMFPTFFRLRGKTYDYKLLYTNISKLFYLPKPDAQHMIFVIGLDPPLRQGQTRYPHLVLQWNINEELDIELNLDDKDIDSKLKEKLEPQYSKPTSEIVTDVFKVLANKTLIKETDAYSGQYNTRAFKCSLKASEGNLYPLDKSFLFVPKPTIEIPHSEIGSVNFSRVGAGSVASSRTFDLKFNLKGGLSHQFSSINKEEFKNIELYLRSKSIRFKDESAQKAINYSDYDDDDDDEVVGGTAANQDSDLDEESPDEDFVAESESEVGEEFDEDYTDEEKMED
ncbi:SSrecog-domain-containing protein [Neoconidiobolus thromboides FSU 785]|nr:SSrecog-domain-containing protein [Neoconidiobolus thromboides FSU 785]